MFRFSRLSSATRMAMVILSVVGLALALGLPLYAAGGRIIPDPVPVVGLTADPVESLPASSGPDEEEPEGSIPEEITPEESAPASMTADEIKAAVQALLDAEAAGTESSAPDSTAEEEAAREAEQQAAREAEQQAALEAEQQAAQQAQQQAEQQAQQQTEQQAAQQAAQQAQQQAQQQAEQQAAQQAAEQAQREAEEAARGRPFPFSSSQYSQNKGGYFDKLDGSRTLVTDVFPAGNYVSSQETSYYWMDAYYPAVEYVSDTGMVIVEVIFF